MASPASPPDEPPPTTSVSAAYHSSEDPQLQPQHHHHHHQQATAPSPRHHLSLSTASSVSATIPQSGNPDTTYYSNYSPYLHDQRLHEEEHPLADTHLSESQTRDSIASGSNTATTAAATQNPAHRPLSHVKRKPLSSTATAELVNRYSSGSTIPGPIELPKPQTRFSRSVSIDSPTLYELVPGPTTATARSSASTDGAQSQAHEATGQNSKTHLEGDTPQQEQDNHRRDEPRVSQSRESSVPPTTVAASTFPNPAAASESRTIPAADPLARDPETAFTETLSVYDGLIAGLTPEYVPDGKTPATIIEEDEEDTHREDIATYYQDGIDNDQESTYSLGHSTTATSTNRDVPPASMLHTKPTPPHLKLETVDTTSYNNELLTATDIETATPDSALPIPHQQQLNKPLPKSPTPSSPFAGLFGWGGGGNKNNTTASHHSPAVTDFSSIPSPLSSVRRGSVNEAPQSQPTSHPADGKNTDGTSENALGYLESLSTPPPTSALTSFHVEEMEEELKAIGSELAGSIRREMDLEELVERLQEQVNNSSAPSKRSSDYFSDSGYSSAKASDYDHSKEEVERIQRRSEQEKAQLRLELTNKLQDERDKRKALDQQIKELAEKASHIDLAQMNGMDAKDRVKDLENTCEDLRRKLKDASNERDNLRDEIVPQLRARVEGLESEAADHTNLTYESTKMQQELQSLKDENMRLHRTSSGFENAAQRASLRMSGGLSRSNSTAAGAMRNARAPPGLTRSGSVKNGQVESREALADRLKDVEAQRDALHSALKSLLDRQNVHNQQNAKKIQALEAERQRLLHGPSRRGGFERDISKLRTEINVLRRRAEDALDQKYQVEKGLGGLKIDLDRAEAEIASLRSLLQEADILIPPTSSATKGASDAVKASVTSASLKAAYGKLQAAYKESLERIKDMGPNAGSAADKAKTQQALQRLEESLAVAMADRDPAQFSPLGSKNKDAGKALSDELADSVTHAEQLASLVQQQLTRNAALRLRLNDTVARGDQEHKQNSERIAELQDKLRSLEDLLISSQTSSENRIGHHEEEISSLEAAHNAQLSRLTSGIGGRRGSGKGSLLTGGKPSSFPNSLRMQAAAKTIEEETEVKDLRVRVTELEKALADAETEMEEVVAKMSTAQIEVLNLQEERESALKETKKLQKMLEEEQGKAAAPGFSFWGR